MPPVLAYSAYTWITTVISASSDTLTDWAQMVNHSVSPTLGGFTTHDQGDDHDRDRDRKFPRGARRSDRGPRPRSNATHGHCVRLSAAPDSSKDKAQYGRR